MTADRSPDATADAAAVAGSAHLTDADREALWSAAVSTNIPVSDMQMDAVAAAVEAIVARAVNEALIEAADAIEARMGRDADYDDGMEDAAALIRVRRT